LPEAISVASLDANQKIYPEAARPVNLLKGIRLSIGFLRLIFDMSGAI